MTKQPTNPDGSMIAVADSLQPKAKAAAGIATVQTRDGAKVTVVDEVRRLPGTATNMDVLNPMTKMTIRMKTKVACQAVAAAATGPLSITGGRRPEAIPVALRVEAESWCD